MISDVQRLTLVQFTGRTKYKAQLGLYKCSCGVMKECVVYSVKANHTRSCGCLKNELAKNRKPNLKHGGFFNGKLTPEYNAWSQLKQRCLNTKCKDYANYGGRGINVCDRWQNNFENFLEDMGHRPNRTFSLDRIDNNKGYTPENCKWSTIAEQNTNRRIYMIKSTELQALKDRLALYEQCFGVI